jgi:hypothetical protein
MAIQISGLAGTYGRGSASSRIRSAKRPFVGMVVLYYPAPEEGIGGGHRGLPAIVTSAMGQHRISHSRSR